MHGSISWMHVTNLSVCNWHHGGITASTVLNEQCIVMPFEKATFKGHLSLLVSHKLFNQFALFVSHSGIIVLICLPVWNCVWCNRRPWILSFWKSFQCFDVSKFSKVLFQIRHVEWISHFLP